MWDKKSPLWKDLPVSLETPSGLVPAEDGKHILFVGWLGDLLLQDAVAGRPARSVEFWLASGENGQPVGRGMLKIADKPVVFPFDWDLATSFHLLQEVIADKGKLIEQQRDQLAQAHLFFPGVSRPAQPRPSSNTPV